MGKTEEEKEGGQSMKTHNQVLEARIIRNLTKMGELRHAGGVGVYELRDAGQGALIIEIREAKA